MRYAHLLSVSDLCGSARRCIERVLEDVRGVTAIEFAIVAPVLLTMTIGVFKFGIAMNHYLILTNAAAKGAVTLALSRGTATPYTTTTTAVTNSAANLVAGSITVTVKVNNTACSTDSGCGALLTAGQAATVTATYPCDLTVMGINYKPSCTLTAQTAQMVQ